MSEESSIFISSFNVFKNALVGIQCSTPVMNYNDGSDNILREMHKELYRAKVCDRRLTRDIQRSLIRSSEGNRTDVSSDLSISEGFGSFTSKSYNGDESGLDETDCDVSTSSDDESIYLSALSHQSDDNESLGDKNGNVNAIIFAEHQPISTIIYGFNSTTPLHYSLLGFDTFGSDGITSVQMLSFIEKRKFFTLAKISRISPEPNDELNIICMQCSECSQFSRLHSPNNQEPIQYLCPNEKCEASLYNPVFNLKFTLKMRNVTEEVMLFDQNAIFFFGVHPMKYLTDTELRDKVMSALHTLLTEDKEYWFCVQQDFTNNEYRIIDTSLIYYNDNKLNDRYYHAKLFKYRL